MDYWPTSAQKTQAEPTFCHPLRRGVALDQPPCRAEKGLPATCYCRRLRLDESMALPENSNASPPPIKWRWPAVHPEGRKFALIAAAVWLLVWWLDFDIIAALLFGVTIWVLAFFRDPERSVPQGDDLVISPADGLVTLIKEVPAPFELAAEMGAGQFTRVSIFMSVFDVHINRAPIAGTVRKIVYIAGKFVNADLDKASDDNERQHLLIERQDGVMIGFTQIAGLVARRIMPFVKPGDILAAGQRFGLIRFGSRVDVYLPAGTSPKVALGQKCVAGETVIGILGDSASVHGLIQ
jgi:phosphatidylserine decarboxylase